MFDKVTLKVAINLNSQWFVGSVLLWISLSFSLTAPSFLCFMYPIFHLTSFSLFASTSHSFGSLLRTQTGWKKARYWRSTAHHSSHILFQGHTLKSLLLEGREEFWLASPAVHHAAFPFGQRGRKSWEFYRRFMAIAISEESVGYRGFPHSYPNRGDVCLRARMELRVSWSFLDSTNWIYLSFFSPMQSKWNVDWISSAPKKLLVNRITFS